MELSTLNSKSSGDTVACVDLFSSENRASFERESNARPYFAQHLQAMWKSTRRSDYELKLQHKEHFIISHTKRQITKNTHYLSKSACARFSLSFMSSSSSASSSSFLDSTCFFNIASAIARQWRAVVKWYGSLTDVCERKNRLPIPKAIKNWWEKWHSQLISTSPTEAQ